MLTGRSNYGRSCANKFGACWERQKVQRTAKRYDDDSYGNVIGLGLMLFAAVNMTAKALPAQTNIRQMTERLQWRYGAKILEALRGVNQDGYGAPWCFQPMKT